MNKSNQLVLLLFTLYLNSLQFANSQTLINSHNEKDFYVTVFKAVNQKNWPAVNDYANEIALNFGENHSLYYFLIAMLAFKDNNYLDAINSLNKAITLQPNFSRAKLELISAYIKNNNKQQAKKLANELLTNKEIPQVVKQRLKILLSRPVGESNITGHVTIGYQYQDNINQSSDGGIKCEMRDPTSQKCINQWTAPDKYPAHGILLRNELTHNKRFNANHSLITQFFTHQKQYLEHQEYNESSLIFHPYYQYQQPSYLLRLGPKGYYNNDGINAQNYGIGAKWTIFWQPTLISKWILVAGQEVKYLKYPDYPHTDGSHIYNKFIISRTLPIGMFYQLTEYSRHRYHDISMDYDQIKLVAGINYQQLSYIEPNISLNWHKDQFQHTNAILHAQRQETTFGASLKIKTKNWQFMGFTPIFLFSHQRTESNVDWLYSHRRNEVQIYFERHF